MSRRGTLGKRERSEEGSEMGVMRREISALRMSSGGTVCLSFHASSHGAQTVQSVEGWLSFWTICGTWDRRVEKVWVRGSCERTVKMVWWVRSIAPAGGFGVGALMLCGETDGKKLPSGRLS